MVAKSLCVTRIGPYHFFVHLLSASFHHASLQVAMAQGRRRNAPGPTASRRATVDALLATTHLIERAKEEGGAVDDQARRRAKVSCFGGHLRVGCVRVAAFEQ